MEQDCVFIKCDKGTRDMRSEKKILRKAYKFDCRSDAINASSHVIKVWATAKVGECSIHVLLGGSLEIPQRWHVCVRNSFSSDPARSSFVSVSN